MTMFEPFLERCDRALALYERHVESHERLSSTQAALTHQNERSLELQEAAARESAGGMMGLLGTMGRMAAAVDGHSAGDPDEDD